MGLESTVEKLDKYFKRLDKGKAQKIKPDHVAKVIRKLEAKEALLRTELDESEKPTKQERLKAKMATVHEQLKRARWLQDKIGGS